MIHLITHDTLLYPDYTQVFLKMICVAQKFTSEDLKEFRTNVLRITQAEMAKKLGVERGAYKNWELPDREIPLKAIPALVALGLGLREVSGPLIPAAQLLAPVPYIGLVSANSTAEWDDPNDTDTMELVPPEMADARGRFAAKIESDCMMPLLQPDDVVVFHQSKIPKLGTIVLFRTHDGKITVKQIKHDGQDFVLHPLNPKYQDSVANGSVVGYLIGIVRSDGRRRTTVFDPDGIRP